MIKLCFENITLYYVRCFILDLVQEKVSSLMNNHFYIMAGKKLII